MTNVIVNIPQVESDMDEYQSPINEWLKLATCDDRRSVVLHRIHGNAASDGVKLFVDNVADVPCDCGNIETHKKFEYVINKAKETSFVFAVGRQNLINALAGMNPDNDMLLFSCESPTDPIVIQDYERERAAIIMPMDASLYETNVLIHFETTQDAPANPAKTISD